MKRFKPAFCLLLFLPLLIAIAPFKAHSTPPNYSGIYVIIDPYNPADVKNLANAAAVTNCATQTQPYASPFCMPTAGTAYISGIFLRVQWCSFELSSITLGTNSAQTCYYTVTGLNGTAIDNDIISPCPVSGASPKYDTCNTGQMNTVLGYIKAINAARSANMQQPLQISLGLEAGAYSPIRFLYNTQTYDIATTAMNNACVRTANVWDPNYITGYNSALDALITDLMNYDTSNGTLIGASIYGVKIAPFAVFSAELDTGGRSGFTATPTDSTSLIPTGATAIKCPLTQSSSPNNSAQVLLTGYGSQHTTYGGSASYPDCRFYSTISEAYECVFGLAIGHERATLKTSGRPNALEQINENNSNAFPDIDCGTSGSGAAGMSGSCVVRGVSPSASNDQWAIYYLYRYVYDLYQTGVSPAPPALAAAQWAFTDGGGGSNLSLTSKIAVTWTALNYPQSGAPNNYFTDPANTTTDSIHQVSCGLNNTTSSNQFSARLDGASSGALPGVGTILGWQSMVNLGTQYCTVAYPPLNTSGTTDYAYVLYSGGDNGGQYVEVETDVAFNSTTYTKTNGGGTGTFTGYLQNCETDLYNSLITAPPTAAPGICKYTHDGS